MWKLLYNIICTYVPLLNISRQYYNNNIIEVVLPNLTIGSYNIIWLAEVYYYCMYNAGEWHVRVQCEYIFFLKLQEKKTPRLCYRVDPDRMSREKNEYIIIVSDTSKAQFAKLLNCHNCPRWNEIIIIYLNLFI